jgi:enoyl-CoA hydratase/carnithine racemase
MASDQLIVEEIGMNLVIRFNRPEIRSPLSVEVLDELMRIVDGVGDRRLIFTGVQDVFASGADLREIAAVSAEDAAGFSRRGQALMKKISELPSITTAAVNGICFGGALDLALACDRRIASPSALFSHPGASLGIITGWGGTQRLPRLIGEARALEMFFAAKRVDADEALSIGLVDEVVDDPLARAV